MNDQEIRIAIAEACGWRKAEPPNTPVWWKNGEWVSNVYDLPDYPNDLNAMHEAEKELTQDQWQKYYDIIEAMNAEAGGFFSKELHATARQRAEAFLRAIGKWKSAP